ncbi:M15 family metallopeptidase [Gelidibacter salicanalis]|uniref:D-alanyl-D-alanine dipeptidase n=1 Tax=Gelidibacter salicanalis TaxID=291193 RepID=A0A934KKG2_9FLAO|nr:M15 family metallopeptidase [Gelidibacter salicanalis]MBJ7879424.1 M15 family metallopeptidase [Gelidibacter salicanalis]
MKKNKVLLLVLIILGFGFVKSPTAQLPKGFVYVKECIPDLDVELRYLTDHNFVGKPIIGYHANTLILTKDAVEALKKVQEALRNQNLCLKVYDGYRPQRAVNHFVTWAKDLADTINKREFYPEVEKQNLFSEGYIASKSGHSRGSTLDLTITDGNTGEPLDMGGTYDFFGEQSWLSYKDLTAAQQQNREILQTVMQDNNFRNYPKEWWHFTLRWEPFPDTYFDFPVE